MRRYAVRSAGAALIAFALAGHRAEAQGYGVYEHGACVMGRSGTGVAAPCGDGSAVFFNPAAIVGSATRWNLLVGGTLIAPRNRFMDSASGITTDGVGNDIPVPSIFLTRQLNERWAVGIGAYAPYGLVSEWPIDFAGRFLAYRSELKAIYVQPTVAVRLAPNLRFGAGFTYVFSSADLKQRVDLSSQTAAPGVTFANLGVPAGTDFADARLEGTAQSMGGHFGLVWDATPRLSFGARYLLRQTADVEGDARFAQIPTGIILPPGNPLGLPGGTPLDAVLAGQFTGTGALTTQSGTVDVPLPEQLVVGAAYRLTPTLTVLFDFQWVNWSAFDELVINFANLGQRVQYEDYEDTRGYRIGVDWQATPRVSLRAGGLYHTAAAPAQTVTPLLPEGERAEGTVGLGYQLAPRLRVDVAYQYIRQQDRRGRVVEPPVRGPAGAAVNSGLYTGTANLFGASVAFGF
jgi:long-chain fatty acid transport protein